MKRTCNNKTNYKSTEWETGSFSGLDEFIKSEIDSAMKWLFTEATPSSYLIRHDDGLYIRTSFSELDDCWTDTKLEDEDLEEMIIEINK